MKKFDKYKYYFESVQSPETDVKFFDQIYRKTFNKEALVLREDFCGTFSICCEWSKLGSQKKAFGVDLDEEPIRYGYDHYYSQLTESQKSRVHILQQNVLNSELPNSDLVAALNFSYFLFKRREDLKAYFQNVYNRINSEGLFVVDCFGGPATQEPNVEETEHEDFSYFWDQDYYNPINNYAQFYIHFKPKGGKKVKQAFSYDWRMWSLPEIQQPRIVSLYKKWVLKMFMSCGKEVMRMVTVMENLRALLFLAKEGEDCEAWVAYVVGKK